MDTEAILKSLRETGIAALPFLDEIDAVTAWFDECRFYYDAHMPETGRRQQTGPVARDAIPPQSECYCTGMDAVILAPALLERGLAVRDVAAAFLHTPTPFAYSMNAFWTRPGPAGTRPDIQEFHRDMDDPAGFLAMFVYLTDVLRDEDGPHELKGPDGAARRVYGPAGTMFLASTYNEHRGIKPSRAGSARGIAWLRWGLSDPPPSYVWDRNEPISAALLGARMPADPVLRHSLHLLAA